jgi:hypothetical protein
VTRSGLLFVYVFINRATFTFTIGELLSPEFESTLNGLRRRNGAVVKIVETTHCEVSDVVVQPHASLRYATEAIRG